MSENEVGFTRVGRALGLYGVWYKQSIASRNEVKQRNQGSRQHTFSASRTVT
jgi:hypothetical protein